MNKALRKTSQTSAHHVIDNSNITTEKLWKDGLHLTNSGKLIVISNFVHSLNSSNFLRKQPNCQILFKFLKVRTSWTKVMNLFRKFYVTANLNLNPVVQKVILLMLMLGTKK